MQISKGLFHVKVSLRSFGRLQSKLLLTGAKETRIKERMHRAEIECYETYNLWSLRFRKWLLMLAASFFKSTIRKMCASNECLGFGTDGK